MPSISIRRSCLVAALGLSAAIAIAPAAQADPPLVGPNVQYIGGWDGSAGGGGAFTDPWGVATASDGTVFVADRNGGRIQVFTADGTYVRSWGAPVELGASWVTARGIAIGPDGNVYTTSTVYNPMTAASSSKVVVFTQSGAYVRSWDVTGSNVSVTGITVAADGTVYVTDVGGSPYRAVAYTSTGTFIRQYTRTSGAGRLRNPYGVAISPDGTKVHVIDNGTSNDVATFDQASGAYLSQWATAGGGAAGGVLSATGITTGPDGSMYTAEIGWQRVQLFDASLSYVYDIAAAGSAAGELSDPTGVAVGPDGSIYVSESAVLGGVSRVQRFADLNASVTPASTDLGTVAAGTTSPVSVTVTNTGRAKLPIASIDFGGADGSRFAVGSTTCPVGGSLAAGASCAIQTSVTAGSAGALSGTVQVHAALGLWSHTYTAAVTATATAGASGGGGTPAATTPQPPASPTATTPVSTPTPTSPTSPTPTAVTPAPTTYSPKVYGVQLSAPGDDATPEIKVTTSGGDSATKSVANLTLKCPKTANGCNADGLLTLDARALGGAQARSAAVAQTTLARFAGVEIVAGDSKLVKVRLSTAMVRRLQARHVFRVHATLTINNHLDGGPVVRTRKRVLLLIPRPARRAVPVQTPSFTG